MHAHASGRSPAREGPHLADLVQKPGAHDIIGDAACCCHRVHLRQVRTIAQTPGSGQLVVAHGGVLVVEPETRLRPAQQALSPIRSRSGRVVPNNTIRSRVRALWPMGWECRNVAMTACSISRNRKPDGISLDVTCSGQLALNNAGPRLLFAFVLLGVGDGDQFAQGLRETVLPGAFRKTPGPTKGLPYPISLLPAAPARRSATRRACVWKRSRLVHLA